MRTGPASLLELAAAILAGTSPDRKTKVMLKVEIKFTKLYPPIGDIQSLAGQTLLAEDRSSYPNEVPAGYKGPRYNYLCLMPGNTGLVDVDYRDIAAVWPPEAQ